MPGLGIGMSCPGAPGGRRNPGGGGPPMGGGCPIGGRGGASMCCGGPGRGCGAPGPGGRAPCWTGTCICCPGGGAWGGAYSGRCALGPLVGCCCCCAAPLPLPLHARGMTLATTSHDMLCRHRACSSEGRIQKWLIAKVIMFVTEATYFVLHKTNCTCLRVSYAFLSASCIPSA
jgi:hypothetical protein